MPENNCMLLSTFVWLYTANIGYSATLHTTVTTDPTVVTSDSVASAASANTSSNDTLACYDCSESFKRVWEPYTECQYYPDKAPLRTCLGVERYCRVERVTYRSMTVSITRSCTKECWHGCYASGFGLTKLKCTSCCLTPGCNTGNTATSLRIDFCDNILILCLIHLVIIYVL